MMAHMADMGKFHMSFYPCGGDEWEEDEASHNFLKNLKPKLCNMQCTSLTERLQLALLDHPHGIDSPFLNPKEKSFLDAMSQAERRRMFSLTDEEQAFLDGGKEGEDITMPSLPSSSAGSFQFLPEVYAVRQSLETRSINIRRTALPGCCVLA
ncbi:unnamed protein product [Symbiodinium natans]|uniref:Uncharacterized protein n=1 Tax=Symbiodinium natans TaxID=878477 RepID=A0A812TJA3_9DINO|nr:unnamed protein product [Symbiodinium natans]